MVCCGGKSNQGGAVPDHVPPTKEFIAQVVKDMEKNGNTTEDDSPARDDASAVNPGRDDNLARGKPHSVGNSGEDKPPVLVKNSDAEKTGDDKSFPECSLVPNKLLTVKDQGARHDVFDVNCDPILSIDDYPDQMYRYARRLEDDGQYYDDGPHENDPYAYYPLVFPFGRLDAWGYEKCDVNEEERQIYDVDDQRYSIKFQRRSPTSDGRLAVTFRYSPVLDPRGTTVPYSEAQLAYVPGIAEHIVSLCYDAPEDYVKSPKLEFDVFGKDIADQIGTCKVHRSYETSSEAKRLTSVTLQTISNRPAGYLHGIPDEAMHNYEDILIDRPFYKLEYDPLESEEAFRQLVQYHVDAMC